MRLLVLASGEGTNLQAVIDAVQAGTVRLKLVAVGSDRLGTPALERAQEANIPTFVVDFSCYSKRDAWDKALLHQVQQHTPDLVLSSGFMRIVGAEFIRSFPGRYFNTHPSLLPAFPGRYGVRDALAYGVKVTGCSIICADEGIDTGRILAQRAVNVHDDDTEASLHERIKMVERKLLIEELAKLAQAGICSAPPLKTEADSAKC